MKIRNRSLILSTLSGEEHRIDLAKPETGEKMIVSIADFRITVEEKPEYRQNTVRFRTIISGEKRGALKETKTGRRKKEGIAVAVKLWIEQGINAEAGLRIGIPSALYNGKLSLEHQEYRSFMEDRLTAPMIMLFDKEHQEAVTLKKITTPKVSEKEQREKGENVYLQKTDVASLGCGYENGAYFKIRIPYEEREKSPSMDANETPVCAFYPLYEENFQIVFSYEISDHSYENFTDAIYKEYRDLAKEKEAQGERITELPFSREEEMRMRRECVKKTYREFEECGAGFFFHFNPRKGYESEPSGFGSAFNTIPHESYTHILEYGFTGRQIDIALELAAYEEVFRERGEKVIDFFVNHFVEKSGWVYSLYDLEQKRPFASFGDVNAPKLHYVSYGTEEGNYLRTMTEPMFDLLRAYKWYKEKGIEKADWICAAEVYASFLLDRQNPDGSWYRAYKKNGEPVFMNERMECAEENNRGSKSSTSIPIPFLCAVKTMFPQKEKYLEAAVRAADYTLAHEGKWELYQGGTMDNPDIVDKEAAQYAMAGLYSVYSLTGDKKYLKGAQNAAKQFVTWNYIWNAPTRKGTILDKKHFKTKGLGAINSIWCGGVVDIYSLFHIKELYLIGKETGETFFEEVADWISIAAHQILSWSGDDMGFADAGMQPEGFGICPQGMDEGMIEKGDVWGTLGWIYSAGIGGVNRYLKETKKQ